VVVYFWRKPNTDGDVEGYSIGAVEGTEGEGGGTSQATTARKVWVSINNDKNHASQYAEYKDFDPTTERQYLRKEANDHIVRDTITAENVLITTKAGGDKRQSLKLTEKRASKVTEAIAKDSAAHREDKQRRENERMEGEDEPSGAKSGPEGGGKKRGAESGASKDINRARMEPKQTATGQHQ
jgi:hypothetical protein